MEPGRDAWQKPDELVRALKLKDGQVACDVGAGPGYFALRLGRAVGITTPLRLASELGVTGEDATGRLVALCRAAGADTYLAGAGGARYMDLARFASAGIGVLAQRYEHPVYPQGHGEFVPFLSALDLLLSAGDRALDILRSGDHWTRLV